MPSRRRHLRNLPQPKRRKEVVERPKRRSGPKERPVTSWTTLSFSIKPHMTNFLRFVPNKSCFMCILPNRWPFFFVSQEVPAYKLITPAVVSERLKIRGSLARKALNELQQKGMIKQVVKHSAQLIYTRTTKAEDAVAAPWIMYRVNIEIHDFAWTFSFYLFFLVRSVCSCMLIPWAWQEGSLSF